MKTQRELDLLVDISKLLKKYGPETFESLSELILNTEITEQLSQILIQSSKTARSIQKEKRETRAKQKISIPKLLIDLEKIEPEKYQLLMNFHTDLVEKKILTSLRDLKNFAMECGLPEIHSNSRQKALNPLINSLVKFPNEQLIQITQSLDKYDSSDRSLEKWSNIILKKDTS